MTQVKHLLWLKCHYVFVYSIMGVIQPYLSVFLEQELNFTDAQVGWIQSEMTIGILITPVLMTYLADRWLSNRALLAVLYAMTGTGLFLITTVSGFLATGAAFFLFALGFMAMIPVLNGLCMGFLEDYTQPRQPRYHTVRIWGTFGFMIPAVVLFFVLSDPDVSTEWGLFLGAGLAFLGMVAAWGLPSHGGEAAGCQAMPTKQALRVFLNPSVRGFMVAAFLLALALGAYFAFYPLYLGRLGVPSRWIGLIVNVGVVVEVGFMFAAGWLQRRLGFRGIMLMALAAGIIRISLVAAIPTVFVAVVVQVLHGPMILAVILVPVVYLNEQAGPYERNSVQGLYTMLCKGTSRLIGPPLAGYISVLVAGVGGYGSVEGLQAAFFFSALILVFAFVTILFSYRPEGTS